ncbi:MAG: hypothetical protein GX868_18280 [Actinobacteria bacterium]|nr:hypothetical protein [Actinomycetota bacterium]
MLYRGVLTTVAAALALGLIATGCSSGDETVRALKTGSVERPPGAPDFDELRLNEVQYVGTHNSYHVAPAPALFEAEKAAVNLLGPDAAALGNIDSLLYTHDSLTTQLEQGIRAFELDVFADPVGGLFAQPLAPRLLNVADTPLPENMDEPGFKVIHIQDVDFMSTCPTLIRCLTEIADWSDANPDHLPLMIQIELKDDPLPAPLDITKVVRIGGPELDALDAEIRSVFDDSELITPDDVRGEAATLNEAVTTAGWPTVGDSRGKVLFFLDNGGHVHEHYLAGRPNLEGRTAFTSAAEAGDADRAVTKRNDPLDGTIDDEVAAGYLVRTRADADLVESWTNNTGPREAAISSGAQIVSTDFPKANKADTGYVVTFGQSVEVRCNVVRVRTCPAARITG